MSGKVMDATTLSALICSRVCHDLINPVGALSAGLEVMEDEQDAEMQAEALKLIKLSTEKSISTLSFARIAFGSGGAYGAEIDVDEGKRVTQDLYKHIKADLEWKLDGGLAPKDFVKAILSISILVGDTIPRGGVVTVTGGLSCVTFDAKGMKAKLKEPLLDALSGKVDDLEPKMTPGFLACLLAHQAGGGVRAEQIDEEHVRIEATFPNYAVKAA